MGTKVADILARYTSQAQLNEYADKNGYTQFISDFNSHLADITKVAINALSPPMPLNAAKFDDITDDTAAFTSMFEYLNAQGGGTLLLPIGSSVSNIIINYGNIGISGPGVDVCKIKPTSGIGLYIAKATAGGIENFALSGFTIQGGTYGIQLGDTSKPVGKITVINVKCYQCSEAGVLPANIVGGTFINFYSYYCKYGLITRASDVITMLTFIGSFFRQSTENGISLSSGKKIKFLNCVVESNQKTGMIIIGNADNNGAQDIEIDIWFENNAITSSSASTAHLYLDGVPGTEGTKLVHIKNSFFDNQDGLASIYSNRSKDCSIEYADFNGKNIEDAVKYNSGVAQTYNFLVKDYKNPDVSDINDIQAFTSGGAGISLEYQIGSMRYTNIKPLGASVVWDVPSIAAGSFVLSDAIAVNGAALTDNILVFPPDATKLDNLICTGYVSAANEVKIRLFNLSASPIDLASGIWAVRVIK